MRRQNLLPWLAVITCLVLPSGTAESNKSVETLLWEKLRQGYQPSVAPSGVVEVEVAVVLSGIHVLTSSEMIELSAWWRMYWRDPRLAWNSSEWDVQSLSFREGEVWTPDVTLYEKAQEDAFGQERIVSPSGEVAMSTPRNTKFACPLSLAQFPFDVQKCAFTIGSWSHDGTRIDVLPRLVDPEEFFETDSELELPDRLPLQVQELTNFHEFFLRAVRAIWKNTTYPGRKDTFSVIRVELELTRSTIDYVCSIIAPLIIVTVVGFGTLFMPSPSSGAKPALCVTILLTTATVFLAANNLTPNSNQTTLISRLYIACLCTNICLVGWSIWTTALILVQRDNSTSVQHFMDYFYHFDEHGKGRLDREQVGCALGALNLSPEEQRKLLHHLMKDDDHPITEQQWAVIGELAHKSDKESVYHNPYVQKVVTGAIIQDFKQHGINVGKNKNELFKMAYEEEAEAVERRTAFRRASLPRNSFRTDPDDNTLAYAAPWYAADVSGRYMRRSTGQSATLWPGSGGGSSRSLPVNRDSGRGQPPRRRASALAASLSPEEPRATAQGAAREEVRRGAGGGRGNGDAGGEAAGNGASIEITNEVVSHITEEEGSMVGTAGRVAAEAELEGSAPQSPLIEAAREAMARGASLRPPGEGAGVREEEEGGGGESGSVERRGAQGVALSRRMESVRSTRDRTSSFASSWGRGSSAGEFAKRWDVKLGCIKHSELHFRRVLKKLGDNMDRFAGVNSHPTAVLPLAFGVYLLVEFVSTGVFTSYTGYIPGSAARTKAILFEYKDFRAPEGLRCYRSWFRTVNTHLQQDGEFALGDDPSTCLAPAPTSSRATSPPP